MNGFELCRKVKEIYPNIPFIILTAQNDEENLQKAFAAGATDYLGKPFTKTEIITQSSHRNKNCLNLQCPYDNAVPV